MANKIMLIRHAEKPDYTAPKFGVDETGIMKPFPALPTSSWEIVQVVRNNCPETGSI